MLSIFRARAQRVSMLLLSLAVLPIAPIAARRLATPAPTTISTAGFTTPFQGFGFAVVHDAFPGEEPDRVLVAGTTGPAESEDVLITGYRLADLFGAPDGLDGFWGSGGRVVFDLGGAEEANAIAIDRFGRILVAGSTTRGEGDQDFFVARFTRRGLLDTTFGFGKGWMTFGFGSQDIATAINFDSVHDIVVAGLAFRSSPINPFDLGNWDVAVVRMLEDGQPDPTWGDDGQSAVGLGNFEVPCAILFDRSQRLDDDRPWVIGSTFADDGDTEQLFITRFGLLGDLDDSFGDDGRVITSFGARWNRANAARFDAQGRIVIAGAASPGHPAFTDVEFHNADIAVARFNSDGTRDETFADHGIATIDVAGRDDFATGVRVDDAGRVIVSGYGEKIVNRRDFVVAVYDDAGQPDQRFGIGGRLTTSLVVDGLPAAESHASAITLTAVPGNEIIVAGSAQSAVTGVSHVAIKAYGPTASAFSVSATPLATAIAGGGASTVTVASENGFQGTVTLSLAGDRDGGPLPAGFAATLDGNPVRTLPVALTPNQVRGVPVAVTVAPFVLPGPYTLWLSLDPDPLRTHQTALTVDVRADAVSLTAVVTALRTLGAIDSAGIANALWSKLSAAQNATARGDLRAAINTLSAFVSQVDAQRGKHLAATATMDGVTFDPEAVLIADARAAMTSLSAASQNAIVGMVLDGTGREVAGATVSIADASGAAIATAATDEAGFFYFASTSSLVAGAAYRVRLDAVPSGATFAPAGQAFTWTARPVALPAIVAR